MSKITGGLGLEIESLRIKDGHLARTPHPFHHPNIDRDFSESQLEIVTPVCENVDALYESIHKLFEIVNDGLEDEELWNSSNPIKVNNEEINVANYTGTLSNKTKYREYLAKKYGKKKMLLCGIHFNYSISDEYLKDKNKEKVYLHLGYSLAQLSWLIVALTSASPNYDKSLNFIDTSLSYSSIRNSEYGYWNDFIPDVSFDSLEEYISSIEKYVHNGQLYSVSELYYPVRIKPFGKNSLEGLRNGISHIELRVLDLNPLSDVRIKKEDLFFLEELMIYLLDYSLSHTYEIIPNIQRSALYPLEDIKIIKDKKEVSLIDEARHFLEEMYKKTHSKYVLYQLNKINHEEDRYTYQLLHKA